MKDKEIIAQMPPMPQFRNYAQEIQDRFEEQERVLKEMTGLNGEVVQLLKGMQETQRLQGQMLGQIAHFLEALTPPTSDS